MPHTLFPTFASQEYCREYVSMDTQNIATTFSLIAFWKGLMYEKNTLQKAVNFIHSIQQEKWITLLQEYPKKQENLE